MIQFYNVWKSYTKELGKSHSRPALENLSFSLLEGQTMGLIGANGAGKSTTIRLIMDFIRPDKGRIQLFDRAVNSSNYRSKVGFLPEIANFPKNLTILHLLTFTANTCDLGRGVFKERKKYLLKELGLWEARYKTLRTYSKGMQQRANFALALLNDPQLLILDEPMSGLDPLGRRQIIELIQQLKKKGKTILFCSHILDDVDRLSDQILVLHKGRTLFNGLPQDLLNDSKETTIESAFLSLIKQQSNENNNS